MYAVFLLPSRSRSSAGTPLPSQTSSDNLHAPASSYPHQSIEPPAILVAPPQGQKKSHEMCQEREGKGCKLERLQRRGAPEPVCQGSQGEPSTTLESILTLVQSPPVFFINIHPSQKRCCPHTGWSLAE